MVEPDSSLRRRNVDPAPETSASAGGPAATPPIESSQPTSPSQIALPAGSDAVVVEGAAPKRRRRRPFMLIFLILVAIFCTFFLTEKQNITDISSNIPDFPIEMLKDVLPNSLFSALKEDQEKARENIAVDAFAVGLNSYSLGIRAHHPVIMIPGVISTGLESWGASEDSRSYFRKQLWGSWTMLGALVFDQANWKRHIMLDKDTGLDPPGVKLRAVQGFDAADFFVPGYWIWNKVIENLAMIGYDPSSAFTAAYDWRLTYRNLEVRDQYFSRLKSHIELAHQTTERKVTLLSHSMGSQVLYYFLQWVEAPGHGNGGPGWVEKHVDNWINISGCLLGAIKDVPTMLSGEMRDTAQLNSAVNRGLEALLRRSERAEMFRAMPGLASMLPVGGEAIWGNSTWAPDDPDGATESFGPVIRFRTSSSQDTSKNLTVANTMPYLFDKLSTSAPWFQRHIDHSYSRGVATSRKQVELNQLNPAKWANPLETRLPNAPNLKIYCFYGVGKPTERAYFYQSDPDPLSLTNISIDSSYTNATAGADHGVMMGEGDGTVNLISMGYMCERGWKLKRYNPAGIKVTTFEMPHEPDRFSTRGGSKTADHVDILGRQSLNELILSVAGGNGSSVENVVYSNIKQIADKVPIYEHPDDV